MKYERWAEYHLLRPDPQVMGLQRGKDKAGCAVPPLLERGGQWEYYKSLPESWTVSWRSLPSGAPHGLQAYGAVSGAGGKLGLDDAPYKLLRAAGEGA